MLPSKEAPCLGTGEQVGAQVQLPGDKPESTGHMGMHAGLTVGWGADRSVSATEFPCGLLVFDALWQCSESEHLGVLHGQLVLGTSLSKDD